MILLDEVIQVFDLSQFDRLRKQSGSFEVRNGFGIGRVLIDVDDSRCWLAGLEGCVARSKLIC
jgi:hypothetical protein